jgi:hypothetical protein
VPLSEDEQRILQEIERQFYEHDPEFARQVGNSTLTANNGRNLRWSVVGFVSGLVLMLASFASSLLLGFAGFVIMLACAVSFERSLRRMGKGWAMPSGARRATQIKSSAGDFRERLRNRFKRNQQ